MIAHNQTLAALDEEREATSRAEQLVQELQEAEEKQTEWFEEQMMAENKLAEEIQFRLRCEMDRMQEQYTKELDILHTNMDLIHNHYTLQSGRVANTIKQLETTIEHMRAKTEMSE